MSNMKKSGKIYRIGALLVVVCLISTVMLSGTFAKYTDSYAGQDTALVARWSFGANLDDVDGEGWSEGLPLFDHLYNTHINQNAADGTFIIAPGVSDEFTIKIDYIADVDADVLIDISELDDNAAVPMEYKVEGAENWVKLDDLAEQYIAQIILQDLENKITDVDENDNTFRIEAVGPGVTEPVEISKKIEWRWPYEASEEVHEASTNVTDTALGVASKEAADLARTKYGIKVTLTATQVTPIIEE